ncbi:ribonuclease J [Candidatus Cerribacteria bacterium 'Amazon FNV 2010 28 9']|uniref:Ribonuclease J n=1 Tax=Candidatus Cerribacteria bacterium 'Amazon FNV 2010 28 9' TaxID=2081795 RepID=A0A317JR33_9BACT|nr:MAG: ribonuclease J [Candidatus Cerribacteria bacterium 'Amazon FNV 2010 28 9']
MSSLKIIPLGEMGNVTRNMFVYEYGDELLIVDCGIGFPESSMLGVDVLIPDITYIQQRLKEGAHIVGMCLSHGHDDHIAGLPYIIPQLPDFEIFASPLTAKFAQARMDDAGLRKEVNIVDTDVPVKLGSFSVDFIRLTHSVPHTRHLAIITPEGIVYHGSDFKFDLTPVDGVLPDFNKIARYGDKGILCLLSDCLRVEREAWSPSENVLAATFEREILDCKGKYIVTLMSSNLHRIGLLAKTAINHGRKLVFIGRSVEQNVEIANALKVLSIPKDNIVHKKHMDEYRDDQLCVVVAGSQGQPGSSLVRAVYGEHPILSVGKNDKVIFATEPIPGNEANVYDAIDELSRNRIDVAYSDVDSDLHVSGHGGAIEQQLLIALLKPTYLLPIGGTDRHRVVYADMTARMGYKKAQVLLPKTGEIMEFSQGTAHVAQTLQLKTMMVDGLGVGDVGSVVLSDRKKMAEEGMIVIIIPTFNGMYDAANVKIVSRGFVFMKQSDEILKVIKDETAQVLATRPEEGELRRLIEKKLSKRMYEETGRTPLILPVVMSI